MELMVCPRCNVICRVWWPIVLSLSLLHSLCPPSTFLVQRLRGQWRLFSAYYSCSEMAKCVFRDGLRVLGCFECVSLRQDQVLVLAIDEIPQ